MPGIVEALAGAGFEPVDPGQGLRFDEVGVEPEAVDDHARRATSRPLGQVRHVGPQGVRDGEPDRIVVAAVEQDALLAGGLMLGEAAHHVGAAVEVRPAAAIGDRDVELRQIGLEQRLQVDLLDHHLQVDVLISQNENGV